jgi:RNA polymerase sigma factor (sigma-70 family)
MSPRTGQLLRQLHRLAAGPEPAPDAVLLGRFVRQRDEAAFAELARRHGPMVLAVCRRALGDEQGAEDACQATFLVLARKAAAVRPASVAAWLHSTARHLALRCRRAEDRRRRREAGRPAAAPPRGPLDELSAREALVLLDEELARLPEAYRLPLVLCALEGRTADEAARLLGCSPGSVRGRLGRGRARLHARLVRRGLTLTAALGLLELARVAAAAGQPAAAAAVAALAGEVPARVAALAEGAGAGLTGARAKWGLALLLAVAGAAGAALVAQPPPPPATTPPRPTATPPPAARTDRHGDPLPDGAVARVGTVRFRQGGGYVNRLLPSPDGKVLVSGSYYGEASVCVWDLASGKLLRQFPGHYDENRAVALSPDGKTLALGRGSAVHLHDLATGREARRLAEPAVAETQGLAFSPDGKTLASGHGGTQVLLWDLAAGKVRTRIAARHNRSGLLAFSPDGKTLATGDTLDKTVRLFDVATGKERHQLKRPSFVHDFAFSPDGATLALGAQDGVISLWEAGTGKLVRELRGAGQHVRAVAWSPDGRTLATGEYDEKVDAEYVRLWDAATGKERRHIRATWGLTESLAFTPDGKTLISGGRDSVIRLWDAATGEDRSPAPGLDGPVWCLAVAPDGKTLAYSDREVRLWDLAARRPAGALPGGHHWSFTFSPDGKALAGGSGENVVNVWDVAGRRLLRRLETDVKKEGLKWVAYYHVAFSPDGKRLAACGRGLGGANKVGPVVRLWDLATGREAGRLECRGAEGYLSLEGGLAFSADGRVLAASGRSAGRDVVWLWDVASGKELTHRMAALNGPPAEGKPAPRRFSIQPQVVFSPDGRLLAMSREPKGVPVWEALTGRERCRLEGPDGPTACVAFSPDGRALAAGGLDGTIRLWDVAEGKELRRLTGHRGKVQALAFTPDGKTLVSGGADTTLLFWDVASVGGGRRPAARLGPREGDELWADLCGADAAQAHRAVARLSAAPDAVAALEGRLRPAPSPDAALLARLLHDLDADEYAARERASRELGRLGEAAKPALERERGRAGLSPERRRRLDALLEQLRAPSGERLGALRAVEVLERAGTLEAKALLRALAGGAPESRLTEEAQAALRRLAGR